MSEVKTNKISSLASNNDITIDPDGTGNTIIASGEVGVGTTTPATFTDFVSGSNAPSVVVAGSQPSYVLADTDISGNDGTLGITKAGEDTVINNLGAGNVRISNNGAERMRIDSSGNFGIGTSSPAVALHVQAGSGQIRLHEGNAADNKYGQIEVSNGKLILHSDKENVEANSDMQFHLDNSEKMRIDSGGKVLIGQTSYSNTSNVSGAQLAPDSPNVFGVNNDLVMLVNRRGNDGNLISFQQDKSEEGSISVSGTTVSYNGGHLSRWSQATDGNRIDGLVKGTVMTNLDQMAEWTKDGVTEDNEQLNCMAVSSVEGDTNVAGVFVNWDEDDEDYTADMNVGMTGDMVIRIAKDTTVARGDLLMSAGDGTAKSQGDDIVRSKTIAKVTSTTKSHTYDDGSYLVPCVLMAC